MVSKYQQGDTIQGNKYRQEGVQAQQYQEAEAARRHAAWLSRQEMRPVVVKKATRAEKIKGKKDVVKQVPQVIGMSGADPVGEFIVGTIGLNGAGALAKTGLWNVAKYAPKTWLGNQGRKYFVGKAFKDSFTGAVPASQVASKNIVKTESNKQKRIIPEGTYPMYRSKQHSVKEVVNPDGTVNPRQAMRIQHEVSEQFPGSYKMEHRLENPEWHQNDPTTYHHTKNVAQSAWGLDVPYGFTKHDQMVAALGHDFGKIVAGDGHAQIGADLAKQVFPDLTDAQYKAIAEHMGNPKTSLGKATKAADIDNGRSVGLNLKYSRDPIYIEGRTMEYPQFVKELGARYKKGKAKIEDYDESEGIKFPIGFTPMFKMWPGRVLRAHGRETIRRMEPYIDVDKTMGELPIVGKGSIREIITKNSEIPSYMGYYDKPGTLGAYNSRTGLTIVDPSRANKTVTAMQHERNMHGTERLLTPEMWKPYEELLKGNFDNNVYAEALPNGKIHYMTYDKNNVRIPISKDALRKEELRTTLGEYRKQLYDDNAYYAAEMDGALPVREDLETLRPYFEAQVDNLTLPEVRKALSSLNNYGRAYAATAHNNPKFLDQVKNILKYSPAMIPFIYPWQVDKKKKGGKTHKPFGHRSILDNGWQSTKQLKNKKNVYGK